MLIETASLREDIRMLQLIRRTQTYRIRPVFTLVCALFLLIAHAISSAETADFSGWVAKHPAKPSERLSPNRRASVNDPMVFRRISEPNQQAFSMLIPKGWQIEGGVFAVDPTQAQGAANAIESKVNFKVKRDAAGSVMFWRLPDWYYADVSATPAGRMGLFPVGSNYGGMTVSPVLSPADFLMQVVFPQAHPAAQGLHIIENRNLDRLAQAYRQRAAALPIALDFDYRAALITLRYQENGVEYIERLYTMIENRGAAVAGQWANRDTCLARAPAAEFEHWEPVISLMIASVRLNPQWLARELKGIQDRGDAYFGTLQEINRIGREITEHRQKTNAEVNNDMFLTLTGQEEYINPYSHEVEVGSSQLGRFRWQTQSGDVIFSEREDFDPNPRDVLNRSDWKRSPVRPRFAP